MSIRERLWGATGVGLLVVGGAGCSPAPGPGSSSTNAQPVSWYLAHAPERRTKLAWCSDDAARQESDDCKNAKLAWDQALDVPNAQARTFAWFRAHPNDMKEKYDWCVANAAHRGDTDCIDAGGVHDEGGSGPR